MSIEQCLFSPLCRFHPQQNGYCLHHKDYASGFTVKDDKQIAKESDKRKVVNSELRKLAKILKKKYPFCQLKCSPDCNNKPECIHHVDGRLQANILNPKKLLVSCVSCNGWVEVHHKDAVALGLKGSKFSTEESFT